MNNLLQFLLKHSSWFLFALLVVLSSVLLVRNNPWQQSVYLSSANALSASVFRIYSGVTGYFALRDINEGLQTRNAELEMQVVQLKSQLTHLRESMPDSTAVGAVARVDSTGKVVQPQFSHIVAHVISNSISQTYNYITIDRGSDDGIRPEMGVVSHDGVVGIVNVVGRHSARIISLLNPHMKLSCSIARTGDFGTLAWEGTDPRMAVLNDLPKQGKYQVGDTVITNGYSAVFPEGIMVGTVTARRKGTSDNYATLDVKLSTNFTQLSTVRAIRNKMKVELKALENKDFKTTNTK